MNRPLRLAECSLRISRIVRWTFRVCSLGYPITISRPFPPKYTSLPYTISYFAVISVTLILLLTICV